MECMGWDYRPPFFRNGRCCGQWLCFWQGLCRKALEDTHICKLVVDLFHTWNSTSIYNTNGVAPVNVEFTVWLLVQQSTWFTRWTIETLGSLHPQNEFPPCRLCSCSAMLFTRCSSNDCIFLDRIRIDPYGCMNVERASSLPPIFTFSTS